MCHHFQRKQQPTKLMKLTTPIITSQGQNPETPWSRYASILTVARQPNRPHIPSSSSQSQRAASFRKQSAAKLVVGLAAGGRGYMEIRSRLQQVFSRIFCPQISPHFSPKDSHLGGPWLQKDKRGNPWQDNSHHSERRGQCNVVRKEPGGLRREGRDDELAEAQQAGSRPCPGR